MNGKRVLVTGSDTGLGRAIAMEFAREGADIALHYPFEPNGALAAASEIRGMGRRAEAFHADFSDVSQAIVLAERAIEFLGGLDVLINNAGITVNLPFERVTVEQYDRLYDVNVRAPYFLTQAALPALLESRGAIVNLASVHAFEGLPLHSVYAGTKGAIVASTRELAIELAPRGVRVNAIAPGMVPVENYYNVIPGFDPEAAGQLIPCGFVGDPRDIARAAIFLASSDSRYIVGQTLIVDGGTTSWMPFSDAFRQPSASAFGKGYVPGI